MTEKEWIDLWRKIKKRGAIVPPYYEYCRTLEIDGKEVDFYYDKRYADCMYSSFSAYTPDDFEIWSFWYWECDEDELSVDEWCTELDTNEDMLKWRQEEVR